MRHNTAKVREAVNDYCRTYNIALFEMSEPYQLSAENWTKSIPFPNNAGCYFFFSSDGSLLYIGKASARNDLAGRVTTYFQKNGEFFLKKYSWNTDPAFVITLKVHRPHEAPSLEEYLIQELQPPENSIGIRKVIG